MSATYAMPRPEDIVIVWMRTRAAFYAKVGNIIMPDAWVAETDKAASPSCASCGTSRRRLRSGSGRLLCDDCSLRELLDLLAALKRKREKDS